MRTPQELIEEFNKGLAERPGETITQYSNIGEHSYWPELDDLEFRKALEVEIYQNESVGQVYFTAPTETLGWAVFVVPK